MIRLFSLVRSTSLSSFWPITFHVNSAELLLINMASIAALQAYGSDESDEENAQEEASEDFTAHLKPLEKKQTVQTLQRKLQLNSAPSVDESTDYGTNPYQPLDPSTKMVSYNPKYEQIFKPEAGPVNPFRTQQQAAPKNMLAGYVEPAHLNAFHFENQRRTFASYGFAVDPSVETGGQKVIQNTSGEASSEGKTVFEKAELREGDKRKRVKNRDAADIEGFEGPWGKYVDEKTVSKPSEEEQTELDEILAKRAKRGKKVDDKPAEEKTTLHIKDAYDYQGRSYLHVPQDLDADLRAEYVPEKCYIPKKTIHQWTGHTKGVAAIRLFPNSGHLLMSCGMDSKIKLWEVYNQRRLVRTFSGHKQAVRDICFNNDGTKFLSAAYDRYIKLWDTETGECISNKFTTKKVPYCVKFNPEEDKQHIFVAGMSDKKIVQWDIRSNEIVQEYDRHLGAVNTITFVDNNKRFVTTSDDKSLRVWEWDIPVDFKYIADPSMHSMPSVSLSHNGKWLGCQSMDNQIVIYSAINRFRQNRKKIFKGHMVAGYACQMDFAPDMSYVVSGDADGKLNVWDWKSTKLYTKLKAHDGVCIGCLWHPHETSKVITCGWDGLIKLWD